MLVTLKPKSPSVKPALQGATIDDLKALCEEQGQPAFRARQLFDALYAQRVQSFSEVSVLPKAWRESLAEQYAISPLTIAEVFVSTDGTRRFLLDLIDSPVSEPQQIEAVWIPEERRDTICISSQAGCPLACTFCMTGLMGLKRHLTAGEIVGQVITVLNQVHGVGTDLAHGINIVLMGMGEPLLNYDNVLAAVRLLADPAGLSVSPRRITLSTAGIVPRIYDLAREAVRPELAISLTAANDELRNELLPINRKYPLAELLTACRAFPLREREWVTFEYVMLDGVNDSLKDAKDLAALLAGWPAKVNLIAHNSTPELPYQPSPVERILAFQRVLAGRQVRAFIRRPRGRDISAACGQLAARQSALAPDLHI